VQIPISGIWFIGFAIGIELIVDGAAVASFAGAIHSSEKQSAYGAA
jgi:uncharacterized membrane protein HdeD (DUF308 family)